MNGVQQRSREIKPIGDERAIRFVRRAKLGNECNRNSHACPVEDRASSQKLRFLFQAVFQRREIMFLQRRGFAFADAQAFLDPRKRVFVLWVGSGLFHGSSDANVE